MKPAEIAVAFELFKNELRRLKGNDLLDAWIAFENRTEKTPDLDLQKDMAFEAALIGQFGFEWRSAVTDRRNAAL